MTRYRARGGFGPAEAVLLGWCVLALGTWLARRLRTGAALEEPGVVMGLCVAGLNLSLWMGLCKGFQQPGSTHLKGLLAVAFGMIVAGVFLLQSPLRPRLEHLSRCWLWTAGPLFLLLGCAAWAAPSFAPLLLLNQSRFRGLCANPNQTALFLLLLPLLASQSAGNRRFRFAVVLAFVLLGFFTGSDALVLAWCCAALLSGFWSRQGESRQSPVFAFCFLAVLSGWFGLAARERAGASFLSVASAQEDVTTRSTLVQNGLKAFSGSWLVGWGPGAFSGETGPFQNFEAHNSFVDLLSNAGVLGMAVYAAFLGWLFFRYHRGSPAGQTRLVALLVFSCFHVVYRHPIFWLSLFLAGPEKPQRS